MINIIEVLVNGEMKELKIISNPGAKEEINFAADFIGNWGGLSDGQFNLIEGNLYEADRETYEWWSKVLSDHQSLNDRITVLKDKHGSEAVDAVTNSINSNNLENIALAMNMALDESFGMA